VEAGSNEDGGSLTEMEWAQAFESWLEGQPSRHTRIAYRTAWGCLIEHAQAMPWELKREHILSWVEQMSLRGYSPKTIQLRVGAISSFYRRGMRRLVPNPARRIPVADSGKRRYLTAEQLEAFLAAIPTDTLHGKRDYALFLFYITTRRRNSQVRRLQYRDIKGLEAERLGRHSHAEWKACDRIKNEGDQGDIPTRTGCERKARERACMIDKQGKQTFNQTRSQNRTH
jgi:integrase